MFVFPGRKMNENINFPGKTTSKGNTQNPYRSVVRTSWKQKWTNLSILARRVKQTAEYNGRVETVYGFFENMVMS